MTLWICDRGKIGKEQGKTYDIYDLDKASDNVNWIRMFKILKVWVEIQV